MQRIVILLSCLVCLVAAGRLGLERKQWWLENVRQEQDSHKWGTTEKDVQQRQKFLLDVLLQVHKPLVNMELIELGKVLMDDPEAYMEPKDKILLEFLEHCRHHSVLTPAEIYSDINMEHGRQVVGLTKFLTLAKDWTTFQRNVCFARLHMNPVMFVNALQMAVQERKDTEMLVMPAMNEILPHLFLDKDVITTAQNVNWHELITKKSTIKPSLMHALGLGNIIGMMSPVHWIRMGKAGLWRPWQERHMTMMGERSGRMLGQMGEHMGGSVDGHMGGIMGEHNVGQITGNMGGQWMGPIVGPVVVPMTGSISGQIGSVPGRNILVQSEEKVVIPVEQHNSLSYLTDDVGLNVFWNNAMNERMVQTWTKNKHQGVRRVDDMTKPWEQRKWQGVWSGDETNRNQVHSHSGQHWNTVNEEQWGKTEGVGNGKWINDEQQQWWKKQDRIGQNMNTGEEQQMWNEQLMDKQMGQQGKQSIDWKNMNVHGDSKKHWEERLQHEHMQGRNMGMQDEEQPWWKKQDRVGEETKTGEEQMWWKKRGRGGPQINAGEQQMWWKKQGRDGQQMNTGEEQMWWEKRGRSVPQMNNDEDQVWWKKSGHSGQQINTGEEQQWWNEQLIGKQMGQSGDWQNMRLHGEPQQQWEEMMQHKRMQGRKMDQHLPTTNTKNARLLHVNRRRQNLQENWQRPSSMSGRQNTMGVETGQHWNRQNEQADNVDHQRTHWAGISNGRVVMHGDNDMPWNSHKTDKRGGSMWRHEMNNEGDWMKHGNSDSMSRRSNWQSDNNQDWNSDKQRVNEGRQTWHEPNRADWLNTDSVVGMHSNNNNMDDEISWEKRSSRMHTGPIDNVQKWGRIIDNVDEHVKKQNGWTMGMESTPVKDHNHVWSWTTKQQQKSKDNENNWWQQRSIIDGDRLMSRRTNDDDWINAQQSRHMDQWPRRNNDDELINTQQGHHKDQWPRRNNDDDWMNTQHGRRMDQWSNPNNNDNDESTHTRSRVPRSIKTIDISPVQELINARSGEMFIQNMQQLMARINMETISLAQTMNARQHNNEKMMDQQRRMLTTNGMQYQQKIMTTVQAQVKIQQCMQQLKHIIDQELQRAQVRPNDPEIVKIIGDILVEQNGELGNVWDELYNKINVAVYGLESMNTKATLLSIPVSNLREPIYQDILTSLNELIWSYQQHLQPYQQEQLRVPGVHVKHVEVDDLVTYFDVSDVDLINLVDQQLLQSDMNNMQKLEKQLVARQQRLNHKQFTLSYDIDAERTQRVVVRTFLGPKVNEHGRTMPLEAARQHHMLLDAFVQNLIPGSNKIERNSRDIIWTSRDTSSLSEIYKRVMQGTSMQHLVGANCRFPQRLLLPRGTTNGLPMQLLVVVTPVTEEDRVLQQLVHPEGLCGMGVAAMHLDNLPLNFPMDRKIVNVMDFLQPNMLIKDVMIMHEEHVDVSRI